MLALQKPGPLPGLVLNEVPEPGLTDPGDVMIEVAAAGICGSDLHVEHWRPGYEFMAAITPKTLGHEFSGRIVERGRDVTEWGIGDRVIVRPGVSCRRCRSCLAGDPNRCTDRKTIGLHLDGAFARFVAVPAGNCYRVPEALDDEVGALSEPFAVCTNALKTGGFKPGDRVLVMGPGTIGQGIAILAKRGGASEVTVVGKADGPRLAALRKMGLDDLIDMDEADAAARLKDRTGDGYDLVLEVAGSRQSFEAGLAAIRLDGVLAAVGIQREPIPIDITKLIRRRGQIRAVKNARPILWPGVIETLASDPNYFRTMITHRVQLADALSGFAAANARQASKVIITPG